MVVLCSIGALLKEGRKEGMREIAIEVHQVKHFCTKWLMMISPRRPIYAPENKEKQNLHACK
jgi:hypothetical protein